MPGILSAFGDEPESKNRLVEIFLPLLMGGLGAIIPGGGAAAMGIGDVLQGSFKRRGDDAKERMNQTQIEAMRADYDAEEDALEAELAKLEGNPFVERPDWDRNRNEYNRSVYNQKVNNLRTNLEALRHTSRAIFRNARANGNVQGVLGMFGRLMEDTAKMGGTGDSIAVGLTEQATLDTEQDKKDADRLAEQIRLANQERRSAQQEKFAARDQAIQEELLPIQIRSAKAQAEATEELAKYRRESPKRQSAPDFDRQFAMQVWRKYQEKLEGGLTKEQAKAELNNTERELLRLLEENALSPGQAGSIGDVFGE